MSKPIDPVHPETPLAETAPALVPTSTVAQADDRQASKPHEEGAAAELAVPVGEVELRERPDVGNRATLPDVPRSKAQGYPPWRNQPAPPPVPAQEAVELLPAVDEVDDEDTAVDERPLAFAERDVELPGAPTDRRR